MKKIILLISVLCFIALNLYSQEIKLPPAIDNAFLKSCEGSWVSDEYEYMGMKWHDEAEIHWILNNQYLEMKIITFGPNGFTFKSLALMTADPDGNYKQWTFDDWGLMDAGFFEGKIDGDILKIKGGTKTSSASKVLTMEGNVMTEDVTFTQLDEKGKEITITIKVTYRKR
jgi:hypothetical protein